MPDPLLRCSSALPSSSVAEAEQQMTVCRGVAHNHR
jgi:hypothetical protein